MPWTSGSGTPATEAVLSPTPGILGRFPARSASRMAAHEKVLIFDLGSQYTQLIARRVRELGVFCEIVAHDLAATEVARQAPKGLILSGGPASVYEHKSPRVDPKLFELGVPVLGICYGLQLMAEVTGGKVGAAQS